MRITATIAALFIALVLEGCTLIGFGVGAVVDSFNHSTEQLSLTDAVRVSAGTRMTVTTRNSRVEGRYDLLSLLTKGERDSVFGVSHGVNQGRALPLAIGDTILIQRRNLIYSIMEGTIAEVRSRLIKTRTPDGIGTIPIEEIQELTDP